MELKDLKPGDAVVVDFGMWSNRKRIGVVERTTATQIVLKSGSRYLKRNGNQVGAGHNASGPYIRIPTPGQLEEIKKAALHERSLKAARNLIDTASLETVLKVLELLREDL